MFLPLCRITPLLWGWLHIAGDLGAEFCEHRREGESGEGREEEVREGAKDGNISPAVTMIPALLKDDHRM